MVRDEDIKKALAQNEELVAAIRQARVKHAGCKDVGSAALRDLGLEYHGTTEKEGGDLEYYYKAL